MATQSTSVPATNGQMKQMRRLVEDAAEKAAKQLELDKDAMQRLVEFGVVGLVPHFVMLFSNLALTVTNQFADEEVESSCGYGSGYNGPKPIAKQAEILRDVFPHLGSCNEALAKQSVPAFAEGYFAIPPWSLIGRTYQEAVEKVMAAIAAKRSFYNYRQGQLGLQQLKETVKKTKAFEELRKQQTGHDILVVACQFGKRHAGRSVSRACEVMTGREFGLGAYEVAIMLLTHSERLSAYEDLLVDCAGDEVAPEVGGTFSWCPYWYFFGGSLRFDARYVGNPDEDYGSATGASPECKS